ncbi:M20 metallopeptidase family protein [Candidatus Arthromitus sp. SFB-rat-Yit]|uniref:M20 metallopeptidase family protein n=1 Tax=Candidatus Arthromitus sp. SFB-rat-Yit TaxID=1041504 RepID=UPI000227A274|nr:M20 family metallopeptidase [Candidatus Arthromitus sp. SFB-rat-Yit]BAK80803.1 IAA-like amino acid hydrolase [Candidatus Arthromitus sp. SFB-rat-Yit]
MFNGIDFLEDARKLRDEIINHRRHFHKYPETGFEEFETCKTITNYLNSLGIENKIVSGTGIVAIIRGKSEGKTIALRSDLDALPLDDFKNVEYSSKISGKMHACGHDAHISILMSVAKVLLKYRDKFNGNVKLIFEPAEETIGGAKFMIKDGVLEDPKVDAIVGLHVSELIDSGHIGMKYGVVNAASNPFKIIIKGRGGHGAHPEDCIDPVVVGCNLVMLLQTIVSREISPHNPSVLTVGKISGGTAPNIIPEKVELEGVIRTLSKEDREMSIKRLKEICNGIATSMRVDIDVEVTDGYPCLYNDDKMVFLGEKVFKKVIGSENVTMDINPSMGVESFAYFSQEIPSLFYFLGTRNVSRGIVHPAHGGLFDVDEEGLVIGVALQSAIAFSYLNN